MQNPSPLYLLSCLTTINSRYLIGFKQFAVGDIEPVRLTIMINSILSLYLPLAVYFLTFLANRFGRLRTIDYEEQFIMVSKIYDNGIAKINPNLSLYDLWHATEDGFGFSIAYAYRQANISDTKTENGMYGSP